jgi:hypothetical protein
MSDSDESNYEVERILERRTRNGKLEYRVKWSGYPLSQSTWEPLSNLKNQILNNIQNQQ